MAPPPSRLVADCVAQSYPSNPYGSINNGVPLANGAIANFTSSSYTPTASGTSSNKPAIATATVTSSKTGGTATATATVTVTATGGASASLGHASCETNGALVCNGASQWGLCNWGTVVWQPVAPGTGCSSGKLVGTGVYAQSTSTK